MFIPLLNRYDFVMFFFIIIFVPSLGFDILPPLHYCKHLSKICTRVIVTVYLMITTIKFVHFCIGLFWIVSGPGYFFIYVPPTLFVE